jgi:lipopolysaccharide export LptBFGC system permease protein LptF
MVIVLVVVIVGAFIAIALYGLSEHANPPSETGTEHWFKEDLKKPLPPINRKSAPYWRNKEGKDDR